MNEVCLRNRQRTRPVDLRLLRRIALRLLREHLRAADFELCLHLVAAPEMARINEQFLGHQGSTDVLTFNYSDSDTQNPGRQALRGELFLCLDAAVAQARRFRTTWQSELVRYLVHGVLHLLGHDDTRVADRRKMKWAEDRLLRRLTEQFPLRKLTRRPVRRIIRKSQIANRKSPALCLEPARTKT